MKLIFPKLSHKENALSFKQEFIKNNETHISGSSDLDNYSSYEDWIEKINSDLTRDDGTYVPSTTYFAFIGEKLVGIIQIRHKLNDYLLKYGGHIGYSIVPSERQKGYATKMLSLALEKCSELGINRFLITCNNDNIASAKTIVNNGGHLENEIADNDGTIKQRYWIEMDKNNYV